MSVESFKVVLVGESGVGNTSIITQFIDQTFQEDIQSTTGGTFSTKSVVCDGGKILKFEIWDTAGQEKYRSLTTMFYKDANAAVMVYDVTRKDSYDEIKNYWANQIKDNAPENIILAIAANKSDLIEHETVDEGEARNFAKEISAIFISTSAKNSEGINMTFVIIIFVLMMGINVKVEDKEAEIKLEYEVTAEDVGVGNHKIIN